MKKKDIFFALLILAVLAAFLWDLFNLRQAFLSGDHREQQYPWAVFLQDSIRHFSLPWWTTRIQCGFPLLAEGQIGAFYPLNLLFFFFLPAGAAYNYVILFHYFLGALLFYGYLRRCRISPAASFFGTLIYLFGSTQGGYFYYNYISQKVVIWLPLALILVDRLTEGKKISDAFWLGCVFALQIFGGYLQIAVYSVFFTVLYFLWQCRARGNAGALGLFVLAGAFGLFFSAVQLLPTLELAALSSRSGADKAIAYLGSMTPVGFATLFYPAWDGFLGSEMYAGLLGLFFFILALFMPKDGRIKFFIFAFVLCVLLALGRFSPLYSGFVETTGFGGFRTPIKFLFFATFSAAVLAACGFDAFFSGALTPAWQKMLGRSRKVFLVLAGFMLCVPMALQLLLRTFRPQGVSFLQEYVRANIVGKPGHPYGLDFYMAKAAAFYDSVSQTVTFAFRDTRVEWFVLAAGFAAVAFLFSSRNRTAAMKVFCCLFLLGDLYLYGFTSIRPNWEPMNSIDQVSRRSDILDRLRADPGLYRVMEVYTAPDQNRLFPVFPCSNMIDGIDDIGMYSPLTMRDYKKFTAGWGYVNDSLSISWVDPAVVLTRLKTLALLNVKYLLSVQPLGHPYLKLLGHSRGVYLYQNKLAVSRAFFVSGGDAVDSLAGVVPESVISVPLGAYGQQRVELDFMAPGQGVLVLSDTFYPGWRSWVNGQEVPIMPVDKLFRAVRLGKGMNRVVFEYRPDRYRLAGACALGVFAVMLAGLTGRFVIRKGLKFS